MYTTIQKFEVSEIYILKDVFYAPQGCTDEYKHTVKKNKYCEIL